MTISLLLVWCRFFPATVDGHIVASKNTFFGIVWGLFGGRFGCVWGLFGGCLGAGTNERTSEQRTNNPHTSRPRACRGPECGGCSFIVCSFIRPSPQTTPKQSPNTPKTTPKQPPNDPENCDFTCDNVSINRISDPWTTVKWAGHLAVDSWAVATY